MAYDTIGNAPAAGICGTGLISAVRVMLETGFLDSTGAMEADAFPIGQSGVRITARDVRALQLAKAAIAAGINTLLHTAGLQPGDVDALILAGGFGNVLHPGDAAAIGLIPAALAGVARMLFSVQEQNAATQTALRAEEIPLAANPYFMNQYMEQMIFPEV